MLEILIDLIQASFCQHNVLKAFILDKFTPLPLLMVRVAGVPDTGLSQDLAKVLSIFVMKQVRQVLIRSTWVNNQIESDMVVL